MINLLIALVINGAALYLLQLVPLDPTVKRNPGHRNRPDRHLRDPRVAADGGRLTV